MANRIVLFLLLLTGISVYGQKKLLWEEVPADTQSSPESNEALVVISFPDHMNLFFETSRNEPIQMYNRQKDGNDSVLYIGVPVGERWENRLLNVTVPNYVTLGIPIRSLKAGDVRKYRIDDFSAKVSECMEQLADEADVLFQKGAYREALEVYKLSSVCPDFKENENLQQRIVVIDSILYLRSVGDAYLKAENYVAAIDSYKKILAYNSLDESAAAKLIEAEAKKTEADCNKEFVRAETFYKISDYKSAKPIYAGIVEQDCDKSKDARIRLEHIKEKNFFSFWKKRPHVVTYELTKNTPIGLSYGTYHEKGGGAYVALRTNPGFFEALRSNYREKDRPEINLSVGGTFRVVKPVWMFVGAGYTGVGQYSLKEGDSLDNETMPLKMDFYSAVSPEVGVLCKVGPLALRYTFQYRFAFKYETADWIGKTRHVLGIGIGF